DPKVPGSSDARVGPAGWKATLLTEATPTGRDTDSDSDSESSCASEGSLAAGEADFFARLGRLDLAAAEASKTSSSLRRGSTTCGLQPASRRPSIEQARGFRRFSTQRFSGLRRESTSFHLSPPGAPDSGEEDEDVDVPLGEGSRRASFRSSRRCSTFDLGNQADDPRAADPLASSLQPRLRLRVQANRPFSAPRMRWTSSSAAPVEHPSRPSTAVGARSRPSTAGATGHMGHVAQTPRDGGFSESPGRPKSAGISRPGRAVSTSGTKPPSTRPRSAFGNLQRRPLSSTGGRASERPPLTPLCDPQARCMQETGGHFAAVGHPKPGR
ncbi:unnamed protein product, partial [Polarella glacialis]